MRNKETLTEQLLAVQTSRIYSAAATARPYQQPVINHPWDSTARPQLAMCMLTVCGKFRQNATSVQLLLTKAWRDSRSDAPECFGSSSEDAVTMQQEQRELT